MSISSDKRCCRRGGFQASRGTKTEKKEEEEEEEEEITSKYAFLSIFGRFHSSLDEEMCSNCFFKRLMEMYVPC